MRRVWAGLVIVCWAGAAAAQSPATGSAPPSPAAQPPGDILILKTAGQPERRLRLLKLDTGPDGRRVADVQDVASGMRYTLPAAALAGMKRAAPDGPPAVPPGRSATGIVRPANSPPPAASNFPTSLPLPEPTPGSHSPYTSRPLPKEPPRPRPQRAELPPPAPVEPPPVAVVPPAPVPPVRPASAVVPSWQRTRAEQMWAEVEPYTHDLANALRPSVRERAATALANGRHASHPEVKRLLARTAMTDPAATVQAHCVRVLSALGYHAADYREFLEAAAGSGHPALRQAAGSALARLAPR